MTMSAYERCPSGCGAAYMAWPRVAARRPPTWRSVSSGVFHRRRVNILHTRVMREQVIMCRHGSILATSAAQCNARAQRSSAWEAPIRLE